MKVILISGKAGHGKDTLAGSMKLRLNRQGKRVLITHYGDLVKYICRNFFDWDGKKDEQGRHLLQFVGTDVVRAQRPNYWVDFLRDVLSLFDGEWDYVLIPDVRFPNEVEGMDCFQTRHIRIIRPGYSQLTEEQQRHPSETALDNYSKKPWITLINDGTLAQLYEKAADICAELIDDQGTETDLSH